MFSCATYPICDMLLEEDLRDIETVYKSIYIYTCVYIYIYICEGARGHLCNFGTRSIYKVAVRLV